MVSAIVGYRETNIDCQPFFVQLVQKMAPDFLRYFLLAQYLGVEPPAKSNRSGESSTGLSDIVKVYSLSIFINAHQMQQCYKWMVTSRTYILYQNNKKGYNKLSTSV